MIVPDGARCSMAACKRPHLPYHHFCESCSTELDRKLLALDTAWLNAPDPFKTYDKTLMEATCDVIQAWRRKKAAEEPK